MPSTNAYLRRLTCLTLIWLAVGMRSRAVDGGSSQRLTIGLDLANGILDSKEQHQGFTTFLRFGPKKTTAEIIGTTMPTKEDIVLDHYILYETVTRVAKARIGEVIQRLGIKTRADYLLSVRAPHSPKQPLVVEWEVIRTKNRLDIALDQKIILSDMLRQKVNNLLDERKSNDHYAFLGTGRYQVVAEAANRVKGRFRVWSKNNQFKIEVRMNDDVYASEWLPRAADKVTRLNIRVGETAAELSVAWY